ncbi:hypothetical protein ACWEQ8_20870 [Streptomyces noursei]
MYNNDQASSIIGGGIAGTGGYLAATGVGWLWLIMSLMAVVAILTGLLLMRAAWLQK